MKLNVQESLGHRNFRSSMSAMLLFSYLIFCSRALAQSPGNGIQSSGGKETILSPRSGHVFSANRQDSKKEQRAMELWC